MTVGATTATNNTATIKPQTTNTQNTNTGNEQSFLSQAGDYLGNKEGQQTLGAVLQAGVAIAGAFSDDGGRSSRQTGQAIQAGLTLAGASSKMMDAITAQEENGEKLENAPGSDKAQLANTQAENNPQQDGLLTKSDQEVQDANKAKKTELQGPGSSINAVA